MAEPQTAPKDNAAQKSGGPVKNCAGCNKPIKKAKRYYRNGKYFCSKNCFKTTAKPGQEKSPKEVSKETPQEVAKEEAKKE